MSPGRRSIPGPLSLAVAAILSDAFTESGLTQAKLGALTGISQSQMSKYLRGEHPLTLDKLEAICKALSLDIDEVMRTANTSSGTA